MAGRTVVEVAQRPIIVFGRSLMMSSLYKKRLDRVTLKALKSFDIESGGLSTPAKFLTSTEEVSSDKRRKNSAYLHFFSLFIDTHYNRRSFPSGFLVQLMTPQPFFHFLWVVARSRPLHDLCRRVARRKPVSIASPERPWMKGKQGKNSIQSHQKPSACLFEALLVRVLVWGCLRSAFMISETVQK